MPPLAAVIMKSRSCRFTEAPVAAPAERPASFIPLFFVLELLELLLLELFSLDFELELSALADGDAELEESGDDSLFCADALPARQSAPAARATMAVRVVNLSCFFISGVSEVVFVSRRFRRQLRFERLPVLGCANPRRFTGYAFVP